MTYEHMGGMGGDFIDGLKGAWGFLSGERSLPSGHIITNMTRLELYAPLLQIGFSPKQIEDLLADPTELVEAIQQAEAAAAAAPTEGEAYASGVRSIGQSLVSSGGAGAGIGAVVMGIGAAWGAAEDCVMGDSQQWGGQHRDRMRDKINGIKQYLHDGMHVSRDGFPRAEGVSLTDAPDGIPEAEVAIRRRNVGYIFGWLMSHVDKSEASLLTMFPKLVCMCDIIQAQPSKKAKMELGGVIYASYVEMLEAMAQIGKEYGYDKSAEFFHPTRADCPAGCVGRCRCKPQYKGRVGIEILRETCDISEMECVSPKPIAAAFIRMKRARRRTQLGQAAPDWVYFLQGVNVDTLPQKLKAFTDHVWKVRPTLVWNKNVFCKACAPTFSIGATLSRLGTAFKQAVAPPPPPVDPATEAIRRAREAAAAAIPPSARLSLEEVQARQIQQERTETAGAAAWWVGGAVLVIGGGAILYFLLRGPRKNPSGPQSERQARAAMTSLRQYGHSVSRHDVETLLYTIQKRFPHMKPEVQALKRQLMVR